MLAFLLSIYTCVCVCVCSMGVPVRMCVSSRYLSSLRTVNLTQQFPTFCFFVFVSFFVFVFFQRLSATKAVSISIFLAMFKIFDVPVFWPILLLYFFALFFLTMKRQINHMRKHGYVPWSFGKSKYKGTGKEKFDKPSGNSI